MTGSQSTGWPYSEEEERVTVHGDGLTAEFLPSRGAKIVSLRDDEGREWLAQPEKAVGRPARPGDDFLSAEMAGWDECAPSIVACTVRGVDIADHGHFWTAAFSQTGRVSRAEDDVYGVALERIIEPASGGLRISYRATGMRSLPLPFLWAAHPQFLAPPGTRVVLPEQVTEVVDVLDPALLRSGWTHELSAIDTVPRGGCRKVYVEPRTAVWSAILRRPDAQLELEWGDECPYLGIWYENGMYRDEAVIAIEPTTSYFDSLALADDLDRRPMLVPGASLEWSLTLRALPS
ncbi:hypothetical protein [Leifsonia sp. AG29]|uniref:hypothetical protein n=1 Tax=Leifsonia sp. AG29 TaxID=2598860 RepID=UPI00131ACC68|nr:hypothetical protein [Leifsonia sp. AG29]